MITGNRGLTAASQSKVTQPFMTGMLRSNSKVDALRAVFLDGLLAVFRQHDLIILCAQAFPQGLTDAALIVHQKNSLCHKDLVGFLFSWPCASGCLMLRMFNGNWL